MNDWNQAFNVIKNRFSKEIIDQIEKLNWHNWDERKIEQKSKLFNTILSEDNINQFNI